MSKLRRVQAQADKVRAPSTCSFLGIFLPNCNWRAFKQRLESIRWTPSSNSEMCPRFCSVHMGLASVPGARSSWDHSAASPWMMPLQTFGTLLLNRRCMGPLPELSGNTCYCSLGFRCYSTDSLTAVPAGQTIGLLSFDSHR